MYDLGKFSLAEMMDCGGKLRGLGAGTSSMEEAANKVVRSLYDELQDGASGKRASALVRLYKTHAFGELDASLQTFATGLMPNAEIKDETRCLTLLATAGDLPEWNDRRASNGHKAIPLPSEQILQSIPMVAQLVKSLRVDPSIIVKPDPKLLLDLAEQTFNVFFVRDAKGSPYVPAQDTFVIPREIRSVLGFGFVLPPKDLVAVILFTRMLLPQATAELFKTLALSVKLALLPHAAGKVFEDSRA
ncbi:MAG: hypothetical protein HY791_15595 [Deltaproteobacteria bacterium]|nr:hypothetical protein [Deltaproteobacteria bacterium]